MSTSKITISADQRDCYQEISNVAMGRAADLLARVLDTFVVLPIPKVNLFERGELSMAISGIEGNEKISAVVQGFIGAGIAGEALLLFNDASFDDLAKLLGIEGDLTDAQEMEILMDTSNILIGACLKGLAEQLDFHFSQGQPELLGLHQSLGHLLESDQNDWKQVLAIEIDYTLEECNLNADLLLLFTEDSLKTLNNKINYLLE
jgi:chemotaxis protein CheC